MAKNRKKYIRLAQGEAMWRHQTADLSLQAFEGVPERIVKAFL